MHIAESRIIGLNLAHDGSERVDVTLERVLVSPDAARGLAVGDVVHISSGIGALVDADTEPPLPLHVANQSAAEADAYNQRARLETFAFRPEAPPFLLSADHEIGIAYCKGHTYQYVYPKGATPADACRWSHIDETEVREELWDIKSGDIVYDLGSAFGSYALSALAMGAAHVVCVNPNPQEQDLLLASARLNGWADKVERINAGLWSEVGYLNDEEQTFIPKGGGDFKVTRTVDGRHTQLFEVQTLDSLQLPVREGRVVVKADLEAAEAHMLRGAHRFFAQHQPTFVTIEVHVFKSATIEQETDAAMDELGYVPVTKRPYHSVMHALYRMKGWDD